MHRRRTAILAVAALVAGPVTMVATAPAAEATTICKGNPQVCDGQRDPSTVPSSQDRVLQPAFVWGRKIDLHISYGDRMAWAAITNGSVNDEVWLDRQAGGVADNSLGRTPIPGGGTSWRTQMFWVDDTTPDGVVRACGKASDRAEVACTAWLPETRSGAWDGQDPVVVSSGADRVLQPVQQWSRNIRLHFTSATGAGMAWAEITNASSPDEVWIDRTFDDGAHWDGKLGDTFVPPGQSSWRTWMYSVAGIGKLRACGKAWDRPEVACTQWLPVCNGSCDGDDPAGVAERSITPIGAPINAVAWVWYRRITLHISSDYQRAWAEIGNGTPGDEVWLERSFSGTPDGTGKLGDTVAPPGSGGWRTWTYEFTNSLTGQSARIRACGRANATNEVGCTPWVARGDGPSTQRAMHDASVDLLMAARNPSTGLWGPDDAKGIWLSANAFTSLLDYMIRTGDRRYVNVVADTRAKFPTGLPPYQLPNGVILDDFAWWGLAWLRAYDLTGDSGYLGLAENVANQIKPWWSSDCGGGIRWQGNTPDPHAADKNSVTNGLYMKLTAGLYRRGIGPASLWLHEAERTWDWLRTGSGGNSLITQVGPPGNYTMVKDTLGIISGSCNFRNSFTYTYDQGAVMGGLNELYLATFDPIYRTWAIDIGTYVTTQLISGNVLRYVASNEESGDGLKDNPSLNLRWPQDDCAWKGITVRNLREVYDTVGGIPSWRTFLFNQVDTLIRLGRSGWTEFGLHWAGPIKFGAQTGSQVSYATFATQQSAVDAFTANHGI